MIHKCDSQGIQDLCRQIADGLQVVPNCPCCSAAVQVALSAQGVEVLCPSGCFRFDCRRDPHTGAFVTGLLDFPGENCCLAAAQAAGAAVPSPRPAT
jgi:hypothetical protein